ncbi:unnamed protein product [Chondrus crispus]|uniref:Uncharacterized protein n=1 Tax=Chondrus crispus TaxID=2769 RepID=R7Q5Z4_CHOCR|nr:unnamed protein product [Chondrus crispus]CDF32885.1 unnamed protein product [Chondrus crispus]|eukprot:XP_005712686.1 unnamed protein product [Chondrus crispus]
MTTTTSSSSLFRFGLGAAPASSRGRFAGAFGDGFTNSTEPVFRESVSAGGAESDAAGRKRMAEWFAVSSSCGKTSVARCRSSPLARRNWIPPEGASPGGPESPEGDPNIVKG